MAPHASWKGHLRLSLVNVSIAAYNGLRAGAAVRFHQLHKDCNERIRHVKTCPAHGEVSNDQIVMGYEYTRGQYVVVDPQELDALLPEGDRSITVDSFVKPEAIETAFLSGRSYYLVPADNIAEKPYQLIAEGMEAEGLQAIARMVVTHREQVVRMRALEGMLVVDGLEYPEEVRQPDEFRDQLVDSHPTAAERKLTRQLIGSMIDDKFDLGQYRDQYADRVRELVDAKVKGRKIVGPVPVKEPHVVNLMDALKKSMKQQAGSPAKRSGSRVVPGVARRTSESTRGSHETKRRSRKTG